ncbi:MAG: putative pre-16S rRNA nuclease [Candidatus Anoxychlamydiales bacterium]|nr:putative pre-16S rRNA nuclease [Candidatus Anoxychlamydiales bacterium]
MRILSIDYGKKRIGLAITDNSKIIAYPLKVILAKDDLKKTAMFLLEEINEYINEIDTILIGLPLMLSGREGAMAIEIKEFASVLKELTNKKIELIDERLTSAQAEKDLKNTFKLNRKKRAEKSDTMSATIILKHYLDRI